MEFVRRFDSQLARALLIVAVLALAALVWSVWEVDLDYASRCVTRSQGWCKNIFRSFWVFAISVAVILVLPWIRRGKS